MSNRLYTQREVSDIFYDVPNKTLIYWARQGFVEWVAETRDARGIARLYNRWNLFQIGLVRELAGLGIPVHWIRSILDGFKDFRPEGHFTYDNEGNKVKKQFPSEAFASEDRLEYLVITKGIGDRGWQNLFFAGAFSLSDENLVREEFGPLMNQHITITITLSDIEAYVHFRIQEARLS
jgi:DNA-binding transcriptional MerR regulator